jgi:Glyoxalase-like domain
MRAATYKDLCMDASDTTLIGEFWSRTLGLSFERRGDGVVRLGGRTDQQAVWVNPVPEPRTVKHRVHLDVHCASVDELAALGATVIDDTSFRWTVMADPEGGELCAFVREQVPEQRLYEVVVDSRDPREIAAWWGHLLEAEVQDDPGWSAVSGIPGAPFESLVFVPVPEPKSVKNRVHLDLTCPSVEALVVEGATVLRSQDDDIAWTVMADPEGNEFCAFVR